MSQDRIAIAVLDDYTGPNSLSAQAFDKLIKQHPNITVDQHPNTLDTRSPDGIRTAIERYKPYTVICTMRERTPFPAELIKALPNLKLLLTTGMRNLAIDGGAAKQCGVILAGTVRKSNSVPNFDATNEQTWALILATAKRVPLDDLRVKGGVPVQGNWQSGTNVTLAGKTLGLLGLGKLGAQAATTGRLGFGMNVVAWSENLTQAKADEAASARGLPAGTFKVVASKEELFRTADILTVHLVLSDRSRGTIGERELSWMKPSAILVNTSRGPLIEEVALVKALEAGRIRAVGLDVFDKEPLPADSPWRNPAWGSRVVLSPHMGYVEEEALTNWYIQQSDNVERFLQGREVVGIMNA